MGGNVKEHEAETEECSTGSEKSQCSDFNEQCFKTAARRRNPKASRQEMRKG